MTITNMFGDLANDYSIKSLLNKFGRFSFTTASELRVNGTVAVSSGTVTTVTTVGTVTTVATGNMSYGDTGKSSTAMANSALTFGATNRRNFV